MPQVKIEFEGIMVLSFNRTENKCKIGIPPTNGLHVFRLNNGEIVSPQSTLRVVDANNQPIARDAGRLFNFFDAAINFKHFHGDDLRYKGGYQPVKRLEIHNGTFSVNEAHKVNAVFQRNSSGADIPRQVAKRMTLTINVAAGHKLQITNGTTATDLDPNLTHEITNFCDNCSDPFDFRFYYNAFDVAQEQQMTVKSYSIATTGQPNPNLPCWPGGYDEPPPPQEP